jgi:hypothetical protein
MRVDLAEGAAPIACTLGAYELKSRFAEIGALAGRSLLDHEQDGRTLHLRYALDAAAQLERLVDQERQCCPFLQFDLRKARDAIHLDITAPMEAGEFAPLLYAHFIGEAAVVERGCGSSCGCGSRHHR